MSEEKKTAQDVSAEQKQPEESLDEAIKDVEADEAAQADAIEDEINKANQEQQQLRDQMLRLQADFENYKRRAVKERQDIAAYTMESFLTKLLPVLDNLERAEKSADTNNPDAYKQGVAMVFKQLLQVLDDEGLKEVQTEGVKFDPNYHHGVAVDQSPDHEDQDITEVFQKGYQYKDKVIRPAMVKVCQK